MLNFIPRFIAEKYRQNIGLGQIQAITLFLDISGFTPITERLMREGKEGAEVLSIIINHVFNPVIDVVYEAGGFISSFAGDAFTAIFPQVDNVHRVIDCAFEINQIFEKTGRQNTKFGGFDLFVKLGLSYGPVDWEIIGTEDKKAYYFRGTAIDKCAQSEHQCEQMDVVLDDQLLPLIDKEKIKTITINEHYHKLIRIHEREEPGGENSSEKDLQEEYSVPKEILEKFIPGQIITLNQQGEFREICSIFISFKEPKDSQTLNHLMGEIISTVVQQGGYFNKIDFGDKGGVILVLFGAPVSHEDNLIRALNFITEIQNNFREDIRAGITMGIAYCGVIGSDRRCEYSALGDIVNQSARFMMKAPWGDIWLSESISKKVGKLYDLEDLGKMAFKGKKEQIQVYQLRQKLTTVDNAFYTGKMVGREKELKLLKEIALCLKKNKFAGIMTIYGEAGMGKSRLAYEFKQSMPHAQFIMMRTDNILRISMNPFKYFISNYFNQLAAKDAATKKKNFERIYHQLLTDLSTLKDDRVKGIISELKRTQSIISSQIDTFYKNSLYEQLDPKSRHESTIFAYKELFKGLSLLKPTVIQIEDIHWLDDDSQKIFQTLCRLIDDFPIMILATSRFNDDGSKPQIKTAQETLQRQIVLERLEASAADSFIEMHLQEKAEPGLLQFIKDKTELNPFYIEQFISYLRENALLVLENNLCKISDTTIDIPGTLTAIIIARIDRLAGELKNIVQIASVLGREVELAVLLNLLELYQSIKNENRITLLLKEIENGQIWKKIAEIKYIFKHALLQEAVYEMQLKTRIRELHNLAAQSLQRVYGDSRDKYDEIANHYDKAGNIERAMVYYHKAGEYYQKNYKNLKAIECFDRYLMLSEENKIESTILLNVFRNKGNVLELIGKWDEATVVYERCIQLAEDLGEEALVGKCRCDLGKLMLDKGYYKEAVVLFEQAQLIAEKNDDKILWARIEKNMGLLYSDKGNYEKAMACLEKSRQMYLELANKRSYSDAVGIMGIVFKNQKDYEKAMLCYDEQKRICLRLDYQKGYSRAVANMGVVYMDQGNYSKAMLCHEEAKKISLELGDKQSYSIANGNMGNIHYLQGDYEKAMQCFEEQKQTFLELDHKRGYLVAVGNMGMIYMKQGNYDKTMWCYDEVIKTDKELGLKAYLCEDLKDKAHLLFILKDYPNARLVNEEALQIAVEVERKEIIFASNILQHKLNALENPQEAVSQLTQMLEEETEEENMALMHYEIYKINQSHEHRQRALEQYQKLLTRTSNHAYKVKIEELDQYTDRR